MPLDSLFARPVYPASTGGGDLFGSLTDASSDCPRVIRSPLPIAPSRPPRTPSSTRLTPNPHYLTCNCPHWFLPRLQRTHLSLKHCQW